MLTKHALWLLVCSASSCHRASGSGHEATGLRWAPECLEAPSGLVIFAALKNETGGETERLWPDMILKLACNKRDGTCAGATVRTQSATDARPLRHDDLIVLSTARLIRSDGPTFVVEWNGATVIADQSAGEVTLTHRSLSGTSTRMRGACPFT